MLEIIADLFLARGLVGAADMEFVAAVSRANAGKVIGEVLGLEGAATPIFATAEEGLSSKPDVFVEYTKPDVAKANILSALEAGAHVVVGTAHLSEDDFRDIDAVAQRVRRGVLAVPNFALSMVLLEKFAEIAARYIPNRAIIDYGDPGTISVPSHTARALARRLSKAARAPSALSWGNSADGEGNLEPESSDDEIQSVRVPGYLVSLDAIFGMPDERLVMRFEAGLGADLYVDGALLAIREVDKLIGVHHGLDTVMDF